MKVAFDTNVILDAIENRADYETAQALILAVAREQIDGVVDGSSVTDIYYIAKKHIGDAAAREAISNLLTVFDVTPVDGDVCGDALDLPMPDYEDAVLACCAASCRADYIVTRDKVFLNAEDCPVKRISPGDLRDMLTAESSRFPSKNTQNQAVSNQNGKKPKCRQNKVTRKDRVGG